MMKSRSFLLFISFGMLLLFMTLPAHADVGIAIKHRLLIAQPDGDETLVTLEVTVTNTGSISLNEIAITLLPWLPVSDSSDNSLTIRQLGIGEELDMLWEITVMGTEQISSMMEGDLYLVALASDQFGETTKIQVTSKGGAE